MEEEKASGNQQIQTDKRTVRGSEKVTNERMERYSKEYERYIDGKT